MPQSEAPTRRTSRRPQSAMAAASAAASSMRTFEKRPPSRSTTTQYMDDDDDLELPIVRTKALSVADSMARFHKVRIVGVHTDADDDVHMRRPHRKAQRKRSSSISSTASSASTRSSSMSSSLSSSSSSSTPSPFTTPTRSRAHQRPKNHGAAAKQLYRQNRLSSLVLHSVTPREALPSAAALLTTSSSSKSAKSSYTEYDVVVENVRTSQIWQVARRFSRFVQFRKELSALFEAPHCHHCTAMHAKLDELHDGFPAKRLWGSQSKSVTAQRARKLQLYLEGLLALAAKSHTKQCRLVSASFAMHVRGFLTVESTSFHGIPGGDLGHAIPSLLQELSQANTGAVVATSGGQRLPLATIEEGSPTSSAGGRLTALASPWEPNGIAMLEKDEDEETEDEEDESPNERRRR